MRGKYENREVRCRVNAIEEAQDRLIIISGISKSDIIRMKYIFFMQTYTRLLIRNYSKKYRK
jgi:hypothetical protein